MPLVTRTVQGVELLATGTWKGSNCPDDGCTISEADLDSIVESYEATRDTFNAPVKLGHDENQALLQKDGYPAAGWVTNLRRAGSKLVGDLEKVPGMIADLMEAGGYRKRSSEIRPNTEINGTKYPYVFAGLALLGSDLPAVEGLSDITKLYASLKLEKEEDSNALYFEASDPVEEVMSELDALVTRAESLIRGRKGAPKLRALVQAAKDDLRRVARTQPGSNKKMSLDEKALRERLGIGEDDDIMAAIDELDKGGEKPEDKPEEKTEGDSGLSKELSAAQARILALETQRAEDSATAAVELAMKDGKVLAAQKETALSFAKRDLEGFRAFIKDSPNLIEFGERGGSGDGGQGGMDQFEPTASEILSAKSLGVWSPEYKVSLMKSKAEAAGFDVPVNFGKAAE